MKEAVGAERILEFSIGAECLFFEKYKPPESEEEVASAFHGKHKAQMEKRSKRFDFFKRVWSLVKAKSREEPTKGNMTAV